MTLTSCIVRDILRDNPLARVDCTIAWLIYFETYRQFDQYPLEMLKIPAFVIAWNQYHSLYL